MVAYYLRKRDFDSNSKWVFEMHFNEEHFEKKSSFLKGNKLFVNNNTKGST